MKCCKSLTIILLSVFWLTGHGVSVFAQDADYRNNPFLLPEGIYHKSNVPAQTAETLLLQAIISKGTKRVATINNFNFVEGDIAFGKRVMEIQEDRVVLEEKGKTSTLKLNQPSYPVYVRGKP